MDEAKQSQRVLTLASIVLRFIFGPLRRLGVFVVQGHWWLRLSEGGVSQKGSRRCWRCARRHDEQEWDRVSSSDIGLLRRMLLSDPGPDSHRATGNSRDYASRLAVDPRGVGKPTGEREAENCLRFSTSLSH